MSGLSDADTEPARDLLLRAADEVELCRILVRQIEAALSPLIEARLVGGMAPQAIDLLDQVLADLATCVAGLARGLPEGTTLVPGPVLAMLRLDDMRRRLTGESARGSAEAAVALF